MKTVTIRHYNSAYPYAKAIFFLALQKKELKKWHDILDVAAKVAQDKKILDLLNNPKVVRKDLWQLLLAIFKPLLGKDADWQSLQSLLGQLFRTNSIELLPEIAELYKRFRADSEQIAYVTAISAVPLNDAQQKKLTRALESRLHKKIFLEMEIDKNVIGGILLRMGDLVLDGTVMGKLQALRNALTAS